MERYELLYFLTDAQGRCYTVNNSHVALSVLPIAIPNAPDGHKDQMINFIRNTTYYGMFRSYTIPVRFVKQAAQIIRDRLFKFGFEEEIFLLILKLDHLTGEQVGFYKAEINLVEMGNVFESFETTLNDGGFSKYLKAYESTAYEIDLTGAGVIDLPFDGLELRNSFNFAIVDGYEFNGNFSVGCAFVNNEGTSFGVVDGNSPLQNLAGFDTATNDDRWILKNTGDVPLLFDYSGKLKINVNTIPQRVRIYLRTNTFHDTELIPDQVLQPGDHEFVLNGTLTLQPGERLFILVNKVEGFNSNIGISFYQTALKFSLKSRYRSTMVKAISAYELGKRLAQAMAGSGITFTSPLLVSCGIYITCGDALRGLDGAKIKTTWKDFFLSMNRNLHIGMKYTDTEVFIVPRLDCYKSTIAYHLGNAKKVKYSFYKEGMFNTIKVGYEPQEYDDVNGKDEFNNTSIYKSKITRITKELDLTAPYRADPYGMEFLRINLDGKTTTDNSGDNSVFMVDVVNNNGTYQLNRPPFSLIEGVLNPTTIFNTRFSPANCMKAHADTIRSFLWMMDNTDLTFQTTDKNEFLKTVLNGITTQENADINIGTFGKRYAYPIQAEVEIIVPDNLMDIMTANGDGTFIFTDTDLGIDLKGFMLQASQKPSDNESQKWTLLLSADNDLKKLIH